MASTISKLKMDLDFDSTSINQIHLVLFGFQDAVSPLRSTGREEFLLESSPLLSLSLCSCRTAVFCRGSSEAPVLAGEGGRMWAVWSRQSPGD